LNKIARYKPGGEAMVAHKLNQQPRAVAARSDRALQSSFRRLHARFHPHGITNHLLNNLIGCDQPVQRDFTSLGSRLFNQISL
jgi:hypothetical protein